MLINNYFHDLWGGYYAQENVIPDSGNVGLGTLYPNSKLDVKGRVNIDSSLVVKDSVTIQKSLRVQNGINAYGLTKINGQLKLSGLSNLNNLTNSYFLLSNNGGIVKRYNSEELIEELRSSIYKDPLINMPNFCELHLINMNPTWANGLNKIYSTCPEVKVGIGTDSPTHGLHVTTTAKIDNTLYAGQSIGIGVEADNFARLTIKSSNRPAAIKINQVGTTNQYSKMLFMEYTEPTTEVLKVYNPETGHSPYLFEVSGKMTVHNGTGDIFQLDPNGKLTIGNGTEKTLRLEPDGKLTISNGTEKTLQLEPDGMLRGRRIKLDVDSWADFVFKENYELMPLEEVSVFIQEQKHLPNVPSEQELINEGMDVLEMNKLLMQKVEELTLYLIQQNEELEKLKQRLSSLESSK